MYKLIKLIYSIIALLLISQQSFSQNIDFAGCSNLKTKNPNKINIQNQKKYLEKSSYNYDIKYHKLEFEIDPAINYIKGKITTYFSPETINFSQISFDLNSTLTTDSVIWHNIKLNFTSSNNELLITFPSTLTLSQIDSVSVYYQGIPDKSGFGSFVQDTHDGSPIIWTLSEPYGAKDWWPCKQSLNDKIDSIDIFVSHADNYKAASNGILISAISTNGITVSHWKHNHPIAAYLIAIAVTNYSVYTEQITLSTGENVKVLNYVYPEDILNAEANTTKILSTIKLYSNLFIPYPYKDEKYGHAQFGVGGGMEHQTMSFVGNFNFFLIAHELAHQWFGDFITCASWQDIWLNEGFATYLEGLCVEKKLDTIKYSTFTAWKQARINFITSEPDGSVFVYDTTSVARIFNSRLSYSKGAMVLHMLRTEIGDSSFFNGIKNYLTDIKLANNFAYTSDLQFHFEQTSGKSLNSFFNNWIYSEGYPIYTIEYKQLLPGKISLTIKQDQSSEMVNYFDMDVPIKFKGITEDTTIIFNNTFSGQEYQINLSFDVTDVAFNPKKDLIAKSQVIEIINNEIALRPNPASSEIIVRFPDFFLPEKVFITNILGKKVYEQNYFALSQKIFLIDISNLKTGVYFINFYQKGKYVVKKFIKTE